MKFEKILPLLRKGAYIRRKEFPKHIDICSKGSYFLSVAHYKNGTNDKQDYSFNADDILNGDWRVSHLYKKDKELTVIQKISLNLSKQDIEKYSL